MKNVFRLLGIVLIAVAILSMVGCTPPTPQTPTAFDYEIDNLTQLVGRVRAVTIMPRSGKSNGSITIYYEGVDGTNYERSTMLPLALVEGTYAVTFGVAAAGNYTSAGNLSAGTLKVRYGIGGIGPGGGEIFYYSAEGFIMTDNNQICHYLEAADDMPSKLAWASPSYTQTNIATRTVIGTGRKNTALILATDSKAPAAKACKDYRGGGKTDWFLPSFYELNELRRHFYCSGNALYWCSSQYDNQEKVWLQGREAWILGLAYGEQGTYWPKGKTFSVRPIRAF